MTTRADLNRYVASVDGRYLDVDGVYGAQCWDQWSHYATQLLGVPSGITYTNAGGTAPHAGWACNVFHNARAAGLTEWFDILPASAAARPGDVAFWEHGSAWYPLSHVATVLDTRPNGMLRCLTQNPGPTRVADLIKSDALLGYLRPKAMHPDPGPLPPRDPHPPITDTGDEEEMKLWIADVKGHWRLVVATGNGKPNAATLPRESGMAGGGAARAGIPVISFASDAELSKIVNL